MRTKLLLPLSFLTALTWMSCAWARIYTPLNRSLRYCSARFQCSEQRYGSAVIFRGNAERILLLTNAHLLPPKGLDLYIQSYESTPATIVGSAPGHDVAVIEVRSKDNPEFFEEIYKYNGRESLKALDAVFSAPQSLGDREHLCVVGHRKVMAWNDHGPRYEAPHLDTVCEGWDAVHQNYVGGMPRHDHRAHVERLKSCPAPFLDSCFRVDIESHGFSGGLVYSIQSRSEWWSEIPRGLVSHYGPVTPDTYVIPIDEAVRVAERILEGAAKFGYGFELKTDSSGTFEWQNSRELKILKGPLTGQTIKSLSGTRIRSGGHDSTGGGHDSTGGGGDSRPGGHDSTGGGQDGASGGHDSTGGGGAGAASEGSKLLRASLDGEGAELSVIAPHLRQPTKWFHDPSNFVNRALRYQFWFRGIDSTFNFVPGVAVNGAPRYSLGDGLTNHATDSLQQFVVAYRASLIQGRKIQLEGPSAKPLPAKMKSWRLGMVTSNILVGLKEKNQIFFYPHDAYEQTYIEGSTTNLGASTGGTIQVRVKSEDTKSKGFAITLPQALTQIGSTTFEYFGSITIQEIVASGAPSSPAVEASAAVLLYTEDGHPSHSSLKVFLGGEGSMLREVLGNAKPRETIKEPYPFGVIYLPLKAVE